MIVMVLPGRSKGDDAVWLSWLHECRRRRNAWLLDHDRTSYPFRVCFRQLHRRPIKF